MNALTVQDRPALAEPLTIGQAANQAAAAISFLDYRSRKAAKTIARQDGDLILFADYLATAGIDAGNLATDPAAWSPVTWGLVEGFVKWQLNKGFAVGSVNVRLSTVKTYAKLATKAGSLAESEYAMIQTIRGYSRKEARRIDEQRKSIDLPTRIDRPGAKPAAPVMLTDDQAARLKTPADSTPQAARDALLICLMIDHGLRASEVTILQVNDFDLNAATFTFYRPKVDKTQTHRLTMETLTAARRYWRYTASDGPLLRRSRKNGSLPTSGMSTRAITKRVKALGESIGIEGLSAHDLRHYAATRYGAYKSTKELCEIFGWSSPAMALRYQADSEIISIE